MPANPYAQFNYADNPYSKFGYSETEQPKPVAKQPEMSASDLADVEKGIEEKTNLSSGVKFVGKAIGEFALSTASGFAAMVPSGLTGLAETIYQKLGGKITPEQIAGHMQKVSSFMTYNPVSEGGKVVVDTISEGINKGVDWAETRATTTTYDNLKKGGVPPQMAMQAALKAGFDTRVGLQYIMAFMPFAKIKGGIGEGTAAMGEGALEGELGRTPAPRPGSPALEAQPKPPIEGQATRVKELPTEQKALPEPVTPQTQVNEIKLIKYTDPKAIANAVEDHEIVLSDPYATGELPRNYEITPDKINAVAPGSAVSFGDIDKGGSGVALSRNTVPGEGAYRLTEWQGGSPIKHADYATYEDAMKDFQTHASRPDANGIIADRIQVHETPDLKLAAKVAQTFPPDQRGMIDPEVFRDGFRKMVSGLDGLIAAYRNLPLVKGIYRTTEPMEALASPESARQLKIQANALRTVDFQRDVIQKELDNIPKETRESMGLSIETPEAGRELTPVQAHMVQQLVNRNEAISETAMALGILKGVRKPYFPHLVEEYMKKPDWAKQWSKAGYIKPTLGSAQKAQWKGTVEEVGELSGLKRVHDIKALVQITSDLEKAIIGRNTINAVRDIINNEESRALGFAGEHIPGGVRLDIPGATETRYFTNRWVTVDGEKVPVKDGKVFYNNDYHFANLEADRVNINGKDYPIKFKPDHITKDIYTTPDVQNAIHAIFKADNPGVLVKGLLALKSISLRAIMVFPTFHHMTIMSKVIPAMPGAGFGPDLWWNPEKMYGKDLWNTIPNPQRQTLRSWAGPYVAGEYIRRTPGGPEEALSDGYVIPRDKGYMVDLYGAETVSVSTWKQRVLNNLIPGMGDMLEKGNRVLEYDALWRQVGNIGLATHKMLKTRGTERAIKNFTIANDRPPLPQEEAALKDAAGKQAGYTANLLTSMFAKEDFGAGYRAALNLGFFSRSNLFSAARLLKYGLGVMPKWLQAQSQILDTAIGKGAAFRAGIGAASWILLKDMALLYGMWTAGNYISTNLQNIPDRNGNIGGHFSWNNEPGKEGYMAISKKSDGTIVYLNPPLRATRDTFNMMMKPEVILKDKPSPLVKLAEDIKSGKDWRQRDIAIPGQSFPEHAKEWAIHSAKTLTGYENTMGTLNPDDKHTYWYWRAMGFQFSEGVPGGSAYGSLAEINRNVQAQKKVYMDEAKDLRRAGKTKEGYQLLLQHGLTSELTSYVIGSSDPGAAALMRTHWAELYRYASPEDKERLKALQFGNTK